MKQIQPPDTFLASIRQHTGVARKDDFNLLFTRFAASSVVFDDVDHFLRELKILRENWGAQKFFYEKPNAPAIYSEVQGQKKAQPLRLYGSKRRADVENLYRWAVKNGVPMKGQTKLLGQPLPTGDPTYLPKGHWADRAHTVSYGAQQGEEDDRVLVCIELTAQASAEVRATKGNPHRVASDGGEGYFPGEFGIKKSTFVSVALGEAAATWDFMKTRIAMLDFSPPR